MAGNVITVQFGGAIDLNLNLSRPEGYTIVMVRLGQFVVTAKGDHMAYTLPSGMRIEVQVSYVDANGNPAVVDGQVTWVSSNQDVAEVERNTTDSTRCLVSAINDVGDAQITATADADLGSGTRELVTLLDVHVVAGEAVAGVINPVGEAAPI